MKNNPEILIVIYTRRGNTAKMAEAIAEGAKESGGTVSYTHLRAHET